MLWPTLWIYNNLLLEDFANVFILGIQPCAGVTKFSFRKWAKKAIAQKLEMKTKWKYRLSVGTQEVEGTIGILWNDNFKMERQEMTVKRWRGQNGSQRKGRLIFWFDYSARTDLLPQIGCLLAPPHCLWLTTLPWPYSFSLPPLLFCLFIWLHYASF